MRYGWWFLSLTLALPVAAADLPEFSLKDPAGNVHTHRTLLERGAVIVVTIPNIKHGAVQSRYVKHLNQHLPPDGPILVIVEDLSQSSVRGMAVRSMKAKYKPGEGTLLLLDEDGALRRALAVPADETMILIFDRNGRMVQQVAESTNADDAIDTSKKLALTAKALATRSPQETLPAVAEK